MEQTSSIEHDSSARDHAGDEQLTRQAIAQFLALAKAANVTFTLVQGRLVMHAPGARWALWAPIRFCLDEFGVGAIENFLRTTTPEQRARLSAPAMH